LGATHAGWSGHILNMDGSAAVASAITIVPNVDPSLLHGAPYMMVSVVRINPAFIKEIGSALLLPDLTLNTRPRDEGALTSETFNADDGAPLGFITWTTKRPGETLLVFVLPLVILGVAGAGVIAFFMLLRLKRASLALAAREEQSRYEAQHDALSG